MEEFLVGGGYTFLNKFLLHLESLREPSQAVCPPSPPAPELLLRDL
jgi:hypothetical protein